MKKRQEKNIKRGFKLASTLIILLIFALFIAYKLFNSLIFTRPERLNVFIFDKYPLFLSLSNIGETNYFLHFYPDIKIYVPGGFGNYRVGALIRLSSLEKDFSIINRALAGSILTFSDIYFFDNKEENYFGSSIDQDAISINYKKILLGKSNSSVFDRLFILYKIISTNKNSFVKLKTLEKINEQKDVIFDSDRFSENNSGIFFQHGYREERKSVQILYTNNYNSADIISKILENNGIRVVDISTTKDDLVNCTVSEKSKHFSETARRISGYFNCKLINTSTDISDIKLNLGNLDKLWH